MILGNPQLLNELRGCPIVNEGHPEPPPAHTHALISLLPNPIKAVNREGYRLSNSLCPTVISATPEIKVLVYSKDFEKNTLYKTDNSL